MAAFEFLAAAAGAEVVSADFVHSFSLQG